ncbi:hypothetical protein [Actinoplanes sp. N902-109]|uniref:hypothetical protein n=1 Tax=Actinoplanes sp. (strain N902-109) TaxID=649831 RepID=UPI0003294D13|nr:hypothetical protein [Actinoplanes sp. N902-109]AGL20465.1 hypothetical protein L083_6955 [Actinoplanes sp. N902-109]
MINHTMLVAFAGPIPDADLDQFLGEIEDVLRKTGVVEQVSAQRHIPVPGEEEIPAMIATAVLSVGVTDRDALGVLFTAPGAEEIIHRWQARYPYRVAWVNHEV